MNLGSSFPRILAGSILLILIVSLCIYYSNGINNRNLDYTIYGAVNTYIFSQGDLVYLEGGRVTDTYDGGYDVLYAHHIYHIKSSQIPTKRDLITVIGVLGPDNQIIDIRFTYVTEAWKKYFLYLRSFLALIFLIYIFHRYWHFVPRKFGFRRR